VCAWRAGPDFVLGKGMKWRGKGEGNYELVS